MNYCYIKIIFDVFLKNKKKVFCHCNYYICTKKLYLFIQENNIIREVGGRSRWNKYLEEVDERNGWKKWMEEVDE